MPREAVLRPAPRRCQRAAGLLVLAAGLLPGCASQLPADRPTHQQPPVVDRTAASAAALVEHLQLLQRLIQGTTTEQAEILSTAQRDYDTAATPSHQLRLALILATPRHPGTDFERAQRLFTELVASPETLLPSERALALVELQQIDDHLTVEAENRRLQAEAARADRERQGSANRRLQVEMDENTRLRKELEEARAKLDAIANIERSLNERKPSNEGRPQ
ncbi:MAG TPA: hypothetical protein VJQ47_11860 [Steroidobacteraceae bacterium]|nr:hypothetical protein [Steroidobacteraceae bacterium]